MGFAVWLAAAVVMGVAEAVTSGLVTMWFVIGALAAFVANLLGAGDAVQIGVFLAVSVLCLVLLRPLAVRRRSSDGAQEPSLVGSSAVVVEEIDNDRMVGRVETGGKMTWAARSADGAPIACGCVVTVVGRESVKLVVERRSS